MEKKVDKKAEQQRKANIGDGMNKKIINNGKAINQKVNSKKK